FGEGFSPVDGEGVGAGIESARPVAAGPDADTKAAAAAYAIAAMGGGENGEKKHGPHRWADPLEGPRGRVVRKDFSRGGQPAASDGDRAAGGFAGGEKALDEPASVDRTKISTSTSGLLPMLATAGNVSDITDPAQWRFEGKWDGIRALAEVRDGRPRFIGRSSRDMTAGYPELAEIAELLDGHSAVLDGEIVALEPDGRTSFPLLQQRMNLVSPVMIARATRDVPVSYYAFDLLEIDGISLLRKTYDTRRRLLAALQLAGDHVEVPAALDGDLASAVRFTREQSWEGVVAKRGDSIYRPGTRSGHWLKLKNLRMQEVVIIGWRRGAGRRSGGIGSLLVAVPGDSGLRYAGRVGTGFSDRALDELVELLTPADRCPVDDVPAADARDAVWVEPALVGEVTFGEWTPDYRLRMASWRGLRPDKTPSDVELEH
ncbi:MAG: non-homologous end-joining DNA ligase, partial [Actinomycetota bacterium]|nr:non-homologous end-joining DNA ligase [Actinomycetota bacterium]